MQKIFTTLFIVLAAFMTVNAQVKSPAPSPGSTVKQAVGLTDVEIVYSRPGVKGRTVFGDLVPYGKTWRTGANANTKITFSTNVAIGGKELKKGSYAIYTVPGKSSWDVMFYTDSNNGGLPREWDDAKVALKTTAPVKKLADKVESFRISLEDLSDPNAGNLNFAWEHTSVNVKIEVPTSKIAMESIEQTMAGPSANDYASAAGFLAAEGKDLEKALKWMKKSIEMRENEPFWLLKQQSEIEAKLGDKKAAVATAKRSLELAKKAGNADYEKMNMDNIKKWAKK